MKTAPCAFVLFVIAGFAGCSRTDPAPQAAATEEFSVPTVGSARHASGDPVVALRTTLGTIEIRLNAAKAPLTVDNFLAQIDSGFYDHTIFHQVEPGYVILGGGFRADLSEKKSRYSIPNEAENGLPNCRGAVAMARFPESLASDTGQFFINVGDNPELNHQGESAEKFGYCVFAEVISGMDVVDRIAQLSTTARGTLPNVPDATVMIESAKKLR